MCGDAMRLRDSQAGFDSHCPRCGYECAFRSDIERFNAERKAERERQGRDSKADRYSRAGIGLEYQSAEADCSEFVEAVRGGRSVFVVGGNGNGKSMLAAAIAMRLMDAGVAVLFVNAAIESQLIRNGFDAGGSGRWERMCSVPVLVLDDLGKGNPTEWEASMWYTVAEARNAARLPTVTTSNYDGGELIGRLTVGGDDSTAKAIVSRLRGGALTVKTDGGDMRMRGDAAR